MAALVLRLGHASAQPPSAVELHSLQVEADLARLQRNTRLYFASWTATHSALIAAQLTIALTADREPVRSNYLVGAGLSAAGLIALLAQPWPGLRAYSRSRAMPAHNLREQLAKTMLGEQLLAHQRQRDAIATGPWKHAIAGAVALGAGIRAGFSFESALQGVGRTLFVLVVLEGQILTHPGRYFHPRSDRCVATRTMALTPWIDRHVQGVRWSTRF
jgi:hypothetical protein